MNQHCRFPVADVHRIGLLDIRLFNTDRHAGNILIKVTKPPKDSAAATHQWLGNEYSLVPIDHGFCLPEALEPPYFEWLHWPQVQPQAQSLAPLPLQHLCDPLSSGQHVVSIQISNGSQVHLRHCVEPFSV